MLPQFNPHSESSAAVVESEPGLESDPQKASSVTESNTSVDSVSGSTVVLVVVLVVLVVVLVSNVVSTKMFPLRRVLVLKVQHKLC